MLAAGAALSSWQAQDGAAFAAAGFAIDGWLAQAGADFKTFGTSLANAFQESWSTAGQITIPMLTPWVPISPPGSQNQESQWTFTTDLHNALNIFMLPRVNNCFLGKRRRADDHYYGEQRHRRITFIGAGHGHANSSDWSTGMDSLTST